jgi:hypothetical protein
MRDFYRWRLDWEVEQEKSIGYIFDGEYCFECGEKLRWVLTGNTLQLRQHTVSDPTARFGIRDENFPVDYRCSYAEISSYGGQITVNSPLLFANFFDPADTPEGEQHGDEYDLNCLCGRMNICKYKAENQNTAYGQGSMGSFGVYVHPDRNSIIISHNDIADHLMMIATEDMSEEQVKEYYENADYDAMSLIEGHKFVGRVNIDVWRWEATEKANVSDEVMQKTFEQRGMDLVEVDVPHGIWTFEHFYDAHRGKSEPLIYARLKLSIPAK